MRESALYKLFDYQGQMLKLAAGAYKLPGDEEPLFAREKREIDPEAHRLVRTVEIYYGNILEGYLSYKISLPYSFCLLNQQKQKQALKKEPEIVKIIDLKN